MIAKDRTSTIRLSLHESIHMIHREDWMSVAKGGSAYLQYDHLSTLEDTMLDTMEFRYAIYYCEQNRPMGVAYFQVAELVDQGSAYRKGVQKLGSGIGGRVLKDMKVRCLVSGNVFHSGDHGSYFMPGVGDTHRLLAIEDTMRRLDKGCYLSPLAKVLIVKELWPGEYAAASCLEDKGYAPLGMEPNMVMVLDPEWKDLKGYGQVLNAKSRTRLRATLKRSKAIQVRSLDARSIRKELPTIQSMFDSVLDRAPFTFGRLKVDVYVPWKERWKEDLVFRGYYLNGSLVGFATAFVLGDDLDVQYVGFNDEYNTRHGIYQRMLVDMLEVALERKQKRILFGRTAEQAKSNLGAEPVDMRFYVRHRSRIANKLVGPFLRRVKPESFEKRSPFKKVNA